MKVLLCWPHRKFQAKVDAQGNQLVIDADQTWHGLPLGAGYLGSYLDSIGIEVKCYDFSFHTFEEVKAVLAIEEPDILGITAHTSHRAAVWEMAAAMKEIRPDCTVVMGGYHAACMWKQTLENFPAIDYCVYGDGCYTLRDLVAGKDPGSIPNLVHRTDDGVVLNDLKFIPMDEMPFMKYELFNWDDPKLSPYFSEGEQKLSSLNYHIISGSRGCYAHCKFCCVHDVWEKYEVKSAERLFAEMEYLTKTYGKPKQWFKFVDETAAVNSKRLAKFCNLLINTGDVPRWECYMRGDVHDPNVLKQLRKAGLFATAIGVESGNQVILDNLAKGVKLRGIYDTFQYAHYYGINTFALLIVGSPGETQATIDDTKKLLCDLSPGNIGISYYTIFPGTQLYEECKAEGIIDDEYWLTEEYPPLYTSEHDFAQLQVWRDEIYTTWHENVLIGERNGVYEGPRSQLLPEYRVKMLPESARNEYEDIVLSIDPSIKISGYTIVKDDDTAIPSIMSLIDVCDEVIVVLNDAPSYMTEIINSIDHGECVVKLLSIGEDIVDAGEETLRNMGIDACHGEWIIELDSDEVIYEGQRDVIREHMFNATTCRMARWKCDQFCGDSHHAQFLRQRAHNLDPVQVSHYGWGQSVVNGYTNWNHIIAYRSGAGVHYLRNKDYKFGMHSMPTIKISQKMDETEDWDIRYAHYSLIQPNHVLYNKFLRYCAADLTVPDEHCMRLPVDQIPLDKATLRRWFGKRFDGKYILVPDHFTADPENPLAHSRDFDVRTFHGDHPKYMKSSGLLGRRIVTDFDEQGCEFIFTKHDATIPMNDVRIGNVDLCGRVNDFRVFDMPVDYKRLLHSFNAIITHDYYTFTAEAAAINENTFMVARDPSVWHNNYRDVVHECVRRFLTKIEYVPQLLELGVPLEKIVWHVSLTNEYAIKSFVDEHVRSRT